MAKGNWTGGASSAIIVAGDKNRDHLVIQMTDNTATVALGFGEDAVAGEGIQLVNVNDVVIAHGHRARKSVYAIGDGGAGTYQDGDLEFSPGPYVT